MSRKSIKNSSGQGNLSHDLQSVVQPGYCMQTCAISFASAGYLLGRLLGGLDATDPTIEITKAYHLQPIRL